MIFFTPIRIWTVVLVSLLIIGTVSSQDNAVGEDKSESLLRKIGFRHIADFQFWATHTSGTRIVDTVPGEFINVDDRVNFVVRRTRLGFALHPVDRLYVQTIIEIDLIGRDIFSGYSGGANNTSFPNVGLWDLRIGYQLSPETEALHLTAGYFAPQFSREHVTPWHAISSLDKAHSQNYIRRHLTGRGPGRSAGLNLGGILPMSERIWMRYDIGVFNPVFQTSIVNSVGLDATAMFSSRLSFEFGRPERETYKYMLTAPGSGLPGGFSIGLSGSWQGKTDLFHSNSGTSLDFLLNRGNWHLEGEAALLMRSGERLLENGEIREFDYSYSTGFVRTGYNIRLPNEQVVEPSVMFTFFEGAKDLEMQRDASAVLSPSGSTWAFSVGVNWYLIPRLLRFNLHYTFQGSDAGAAGAEDIFNELIIESGTKVQRGNWLGLGVLLRL